ncbi:Ogr/Delta-like zinc finger [Methylocaldum szegediense]|uniref:Ogr/Delta-like zinc finger n=2 Tax=Methylocaldum szegediense TaxID=73780 RepID=A0ABM9I6A1_9GAMM|nr:Ogr/Delta-like zinc finger [Methylocaldum szegediense]
MGRSHRRAKSFMRINCPHCGGKAAITSRHPQTKTAVNLYCHCRNVASCGATFVYCLALSHTINPPVNVTAQLAATIIRALPAEERAKLRGMVDL